jgi:hypothetical protein
MLGGEDNIPHPCLFAGIGPLLRVEVHRIEIFL